MSQPERRHGPPGRTSKVAPSARTGQSRNPNGWRPGYRPGLERFAEEIKAKFDDLQGAVKREAIGRRAFELWHKAGRPKGRDLEFWLRAEGEQREDHMTHVYEDDIRARAYKLWEEAGRPEGRMDEFWQKAERQLEEEQVKRELKTPDTL